MKNKQTLLIIALIVIIALAMVGCNEDNNDTTPPTVTITNANQTKTLAPDLVIELSATVTQGTNPIQSKEWTLKNATVDGVTPVFADKTAATTTVTGIKKAGTFVFELKVKDTTGVEGTATVTVVVNAMTVTANIVVPAIPITTLPATTLDFGLPSSYTGYNSDFPNGCITYTLKDNKNNNFNGQVNAGDSTLGYVNSEGITFTQTFYYNNQVVGTRSVLLRFSTSVGGRFSAIDANLADSEATITPDGSWATRGIIPPITLTLSKTITEILPPPITKIVTVSFPASFSASTNINFSPTSYIPENGWGDFSQSEIIYTVTCTELSKTYNSSTGFNVNLSEGYTEGNTYTFTQIFKVGSVEAGRQVIKANVLFGTFASLRDINNVALSPQAIPSITLTLTKPGTW